MSRGRKPKTLAEKPPRCIIKIDDNYRAIFNEMCITLQKKISQEEIEEVVAEAEIPDEKEDAEGGWKVSGYFVSWGGMIKHLIRLYTLEKVKLSVKKDKIVMLTDLGRMFKESEKEVEVLVKGWQ